MKTDGGVLLIFSVIIIEALVMFIPHAAINGEVLGRVLGTLDAIALCIVHFRWGSSQGSRDKDVLLANSTPIQLGASSPNSQPPETGKTQP